MIGTTVRADDPGDDPGLALRRTPVVEVFEKTKPAVVNIASTQIVQLRSRGMDSLFDQFFDMPGPSPFRREIKQRSVGSGFVIHRDGYIVTNAHVVARTADRTVGFDDTTSYEARIIAIDPEHDLAVLKIDAPKPLPVIQLGRSDDLMVGETVVAIGNPLGYQHTVTAGVISALNRTIELGDHQKFTELIQTDASINPGNSGGPLLNVLGQLVGINTAIRADAQNIGFAIPVDHLRKLLPEMLDVERRYHIRTGLTVDNARVCRIDTVTPDSPAAQARLRVGDVITAIDGQPVQSSIDWHIALIGKSPKDHLALTVRHENKSQTLDLVLGARPLPDGGKLLAQRFGIEAQTLTPAKARASGLPGLRGLIVTRILPDTPADRAGMRPGDIIIQLDRHEVDQLDRVGDLLETLNPGDAMQVGLIRVEQRMLFRYLIRLTAE